jgi:hypothetical protein
MTDGNAELATAFAALDLEALRSIAEAATPGHWTANVLGSEGYAVVAEHPNGGLRRLRVSRHGYEDWDTDKANAEHVAAFDPPTVLALIEALDQCMRNDSR